MNFVIESEGFHHWIVKCFEKGKLAELHRFYRSLENFVYHRGNHGQHEPEAYKALMKHFDEVPELKFEGPPQRKSARKKER